MFSVMIDQTEVKVDASTGKVLIIDMNNDDEKDTGETADDTVESKVAATPVK